MCFGPNLLYWMLNLGPVSQIPVAQGTLVALLPHIRFFAAQRGKMGWEGEVSTKDSGEISPYVWSGSFMVLPTKFGYG